MFAQGLGVDEEFGPAAPTAVQTIAQAATDMTGLQRNIVYAIGAGLLAYVAYRLYLGE